MERTHRHLDARTLVEGALCIALAAVLNLIGLQAPFGGKISLGMLPIIVFALRRGALPGAIAGALFGIVDMQIEPFFVHPVQIVLDYVLAFGLLGYVTGLFSTWWVTASRRSAAAGALPAVVATAAGATARFVAHWVSGVVFFATAAQGGPLANGKSAFASVSALGAAGLYSLLYNGAYLLPSALASAVLAAVLLPALQRIVPVGPAAGETRRDPGGTAQT